MLTQEIGLFNLFQSHIGSLFARYTRRGISIWYTVRCLYFYIAYNVYSRFAHLHTGIL